MEEVLPNHFSDLLGKLFFAAAFADKEIRPEEIEKMNELIETEWKNTRIQDAFYNCVNMNYDRRKAIDELRIHLEQYPELFSRTISQKIIDTAYTIADASSGTNKSEIIYLSQLTNVLKASK